MRRSILASLLFVGSASAKACQGKPDLAPEAPLRIGKKYTPPACAKQSKKGDQLRVLFTGTLLSDCSTFDVGFYDGIEFELGAEYAPVPKGWHSGLRGMCVFEKRKLTVPGLLGYPEDVQEPKVPANATLVFEVELIGLNGKKPKKDKGREPGSQAAQAKKPMRPKPPEPEPGAGGGMGGPPGMEGMGDMGGMGGMPGMMDTEGMAGAGKDEM